MDLFWSEIQTLSSARQYRNVSFERHPSDALGDDFVEGPPDLAIEIVAEPVTVDLMSSIVDVYLQARTPLLWLVMPAARMVMVHYPDFTGQLLSVRDVLAGGDVRPGFSLPVVEVFKDLELSR